MRSAPKSMGADAMQWIFQQHGVKPMLHYLDDFLVIGTRECKQALETALGLCRRLGNPYQCTRQRDLVTSLPPPLG